MILWSGFAIGRCMDFSGASRISCMVIENSHGCQPKNRGKTPKSSILIGFSIINHPFWGTPIFGNTHMLILFGLFDVPFFTSPVRLFVKLSGPYSQTKIDLVRCRLNLEDDRLFGNL